MKIKLIIFLLAVLPSLLLAQPNPPSDLNGEDLRDWLKSNWYDGYHTELTYKNARIAMYGTIDVADDGNVYCVYSGFNQSSAAVSFLDPINAEHTVPQSWFSQALPMRSDIHHLFPTHKDVNRERGSDPFDDIDDSSTNDWYIGDETGLESVSTIPTTNIDDYSEDTNSLFEPREEHKGDLARAVFYFYTMYPTQAGPITDIVNGGDLDLLYQWHLNDPVDSWELQRNDRIETEQGNRNPYIDYPEIVCKAWNITCTSEETPTITISESLTDFGTVAFSNTSTEQSYTVSGTDLTNDITISASADFEIALTTNDADFGEEIVLNHSGGDVTATTIYVRFTPSTDANNTINGTITHTSSGATDETIDVSGTEENSTNDPAIAISENSLIYGEVSFGNSSTAQTYTVEGNNLTQDISITASSGFEISLDDVDANYTDNITLNHSGGAVSSTTIFARFKPTGDVNTVVTGSIAHESDGATTQTVEVSGTEAGLPEITFSGNAIVIDPTETYTILIKSDRSLDEDLPISLEIASTSNIEYSTNGFTTTPAEENEVITTTLLAGEITTSFQLNFGDAINSTVSKSIEFSLLEDDNYSVGANSLFEITINPGEKEGTVTSTEPELENETIVHPNPANDLIQINANKKLTRVKIYNIRGEKVYQSESVGTIDVSNWKAGVYYMLLFKKELATTHKILIAR